MYARWLIALTAPALNLIRRASEPSQHLVKRNAARLTSSPEEPLPHGRALQEVLRLWFGREFTPYRDEEEESGILLSQG